MCVPSDIFVGAHHIEFVRDRIVNTDREAIPFFDLVGL